MKYKKGTIVKILGEWLEVVGTIPHRVHLHGKGWVDAAWIDALAEAYKLHEEKPFEWVKVGGLREVFDVLGLSGIEHERLDKRLTEVFGDPTERTYNGEDASEFGLEDEDCVLYLSQNNKDWLALSFRDLTAKDVWRKMPTVLTINK